MSQPSSSLDPRWLLYCAGRHFQNWQITQWMNRVDNVRKQRIPKSFWNVLFSDVVHPIRFLLHPAEVVNGKTTIQLL
jgi:hypothetical protein